MKRNQIVLLAIIVLVIFPGYSFGINGSLLDSQSVRCNGMGATNIANTMDSTVIANNPALMSLGKEGSFDVGIGVLMPKSSFKNDLNNKDGEDINVITPSVSWSSELSGNFKIGLGVFPVGGLASRFRLSHELYNQEVYESNLQFMKCLLGLSYRLNSKISIGFSGGVGYQDIRLRTPYEMHSNDSGLLGATSFIDLEMNGVGMCGIIGGQYSVSENLRFGFVYKSPTKLKLSGETNVRADAYLASFGLDAKTAMKIGSSQYKVDVEYEWPQTIGLGSVYSIHDWFFAVDIEWINWSSVMNKLDLEFSNGDSLLLPGEMKDPLPLDWGDQLVFRAGVEYSVSKKIALRTGLSYGKSPVPSETYMTVIHPISELSSSVGCGIKLSENVIVNLAYQYSFPKEQVSSTSKASREHDDSKVSLDIHALFIGLSVKY